MSPIQTKTRSYDYSDEGHNLANVMSMSGLDYLNSYISQPGAMGPSMASTMNLSAPTNLREGYAEIEADPDEFLLNLMGTVHGGFAATVMDSVLGIAVHTALPPGTGFTTAELKLNFTRPILPSTGRLLANGQVVHQGRKMITVEGRLTGVEDGKLYAHATATCFVLKIG